MGHGLPEEVVARAVAVLAVPASLLSFSGASAQIAAEAAPMLRMDLDISRCPDRAAPDEIIVCGGRDDQQRYRLPLRGERGSVYGLGNVRGEIPRASAEANPTADCGIFEGQRRCGKAEMREHGYYRGRDPITVVTKVIESVFDPE